MHVQGYFKLGEGTIKIEGGAVRLIFESGCRLSLGEGGVVHISFVYIFMGCFILIEAGLHGDLDAHRVKNAENNEDVDGVSFMLVLTYRLPFTLFTYCTEMTDNQTGLISQYHSMNLSPLPTRFILPLYTTMI